MSIFIVLSEKGLGLSLATLGTLLACASCDPAASPAIRHPTSGNRPRHAIQTVKMEDASDALRSLAAAIVGAQRIVSIGALGGPESAVLGFVQDVQIKADSFVWILDSGLNKVSAFDFDGELAWSLGRRGEGPTEFLAPSSIEMLSDSLLVVSDRGATLRFVERTGSDWSLRDITALSISPFDMCVLGQDLYVSGWDRGTGRVIQLVDHNGQPGPAFGREYRSKNLAVAGSLSKGPVACSGDVVVHTFYPLPYIWAYDGAGTKRWTSEISDFVIMSIVESVMPDGRPAVLFGGGNYDNYDVIVNAVGMGAEFCLVQVGRHTEGSDRERREFSSLRSYLVEVASGVNVLISDTLALVGSVRNDHMATYSNDPIPEVTVWRLRSSGNDPRRHKRRQELEPQT